MTRDEFARMIADGVDLRTIPEGRQSWFPEWQGWFSDREAALYARVARYCRVIEIGTWKGRSALCAVAGGAEQVVCVDTWRGDAYTGKGNFWPEFYENAQADIEAGRIVPIMGELERVRDVIAWGKANVVHYDADHSVEALDKCRMLMARMVHFFGCPLLVHDCDYPETREWCVSLEGVAYRADRLAVIFPNDARRENFRLKLDELDQL